MLLNVLRSLINAAQVSHLYPAAIYRDCNATASSSEVGDPLEDDYNWLDMVHWSNFLTYASPPPRVQDPSQSPVPGLTFAVNISAGYYSSEHEAKTDLAAWSSVAEMRLLNETISPAKRFFRIGTAESIPWSYLRRNERTGELLRF